MLAVGPLVKDIEPGDRVRFNPYAGYVVTGEVSVTFVHEADIFGIIEGVVESIDICIGSNSNCNL